jgi:NAD+ diphosphatase
MSELRADTSGLEGAWHAPDTRFIAIWNSRCMVAADRAVLLSLKELGTGWQPQDGIYLGRLEDRHIFAVGLADEFTDNGPGEPDFENFRGILSGLSADDAALLAYAKGMVEWAKKHRHCGVCGQSNHSVDGGFVLECSSADCDTRSFPRLDPAIIVLTLHGDHCLLGRQTTWPEGRFSTVAGFIEPGESLEDAVRREVKEETDIDVGDVHYMGSQPWPFPTALMIGFHATALSTDIHRNDGELAEAGWFTREQIAAGQVVLPPNSSIAFRLIEHWFNLWDGSTLASYELSGDFSRKTGERT